MTISPPPLPHPSAPERALIVGCLASIRWRLWTVRVSERLTLSLQWGAAIAVPLTASRLLRNGIPWEDHPWSAAFLAVLPMLAGLWLLGLMGRRFRPITMGLSPLLIRIAGVTTILLSIAQLLLTFLPQGASIPTWSVPVGCVALFAIVGIASVRMIDNRAAAIFVDQQVGLHERVATALEMLETPAESELESSFRMPVIASAVAACRQVKDAKVGYARLNSRVYASAAVVAIAAAGLTLLNPLPARATTFRKPIAIEVRKAKDLQQFLKEAEEKKLPGDKVTAEKLKPLQNAVTQLQQGNMSQIESNAVLNEAKEQMKRDMDGMKASDDVQKMLKQMEQTKDFAKASDDMKNAQMQKAQGNDAAAQENAAKEALKQAGDAMAQKMKAGQMNDADKKGLADQLQNAANQAAGDPQLQKDLQAAADAAKNGDADKMNQNMQAAGQRMAQQQADKQMAQDAINKAMDQINRMQNQDPGAQSVMGDQGGDPGAGGDQGGNQGQKPGDQGGNQAGNQGGNQPGGDQAGNQMAGGNPGGKGSGGDKDGQSTMIENKGGPGGPHEGPINGKESFVRIYDPNVTQSKGSMEKLGSVIQPLKGPAVGSMDVMGNADKNDPNIKNYSDMLPEAKQQAMDELTRQEYPPQYQEMVRRFYEK